MTSDTFQQVNQNVSADILGGQCSIQTTSDLTPLLCIGLKKAVIPSSFENIISKIFSLVSVGVLLTVLWRIVQSCMGRRGGGGGHPFSGSPWFGGNDDNSGGGPPPAKGYRSYQPSTGVAGMSPGFWAGLGLGGLGAYMMNRPRQERTTHRLVKTT